MARRASPGPLPSALSPSSSTATTAMPAPPSRSRIAWPGADVTDRSASDVGPCADPRVVSGHVPRIASTSRARERSCERGRPIGWVACRQATGGVDTVTAMSIPPVRTYTGYGYQLGGPGAWNLHNVPVGGALRTAWYDETDPIDPTLTFVQRAMTMFAARLG